MMTSDAITAIASFEGYAELCLVYVTVGCAATINQRSSLMPQRSTGSNQSVLHLPFRCRNLGFEIFFAMITYLTM
jgi:hypothetical protein